MLTWISSEFFSRSPMLLYPLVALLIFCVVFVVMTARVLLAPRRNIERMARLPLEDTSEVEHG